MATKKVPKLKTFWILNSATEDGEVRVIAPTLGAVRKAIRDSAEAGDWLIWRDGAGRDTATRYALRTWTVYHTGDGRGLGRWSGPVLSEAQARRDVREAKRLGFHVEISEN